MEGITAFVKETIFGLCLLLLIPSLATAIHLWYRKRARTILWYSLLAVSAFLFAAALWNLLTLPVFDFVDRCRPAGTGMCVDGRSFEAARREILGEQIRAVLLFLLLPLGLGAGGMYRLLPKHNP